MRLTLPLLLATFALHGCAYIGQVEFELKADSLDQDKDGAPFGGPDKDCDDENPDRAPGNEEIPYDGIDNDCDGVDVVDLDGDGYPGISKADFDALNPQAAWPEGVDQNADVDCADDPAVFPNAAQIFPGNPSDPEYDGIDADCAGDNDFDADADGYMPAEMEAAFNDYVALWGYDHLTAGAQFGDCNDFRASANPGTNPADDAWYDGHDDDCAGDNDFDADADGYMPNEHPDDQSPLAADYADFVELYHPNGAPWTEQWDDCLDQDHPDLPLAVPAEVYPGNPLDGAYDGIDSDCGCDNDFDADGDGVMPDTAMTGFANYVVDWGCGGLVEVYGDCNDNDPAAYPGALEFLGDAEDSDCDLDPDTTPFGFDVLAWERPRAPRVVKTDNHYIVVAAGDHVDLGGLVKAYAGLALPLAHNAGFEAELDTNPTQWQGAAAPLPLGGVLDAAAQGSDMSGAITYTFPGVSSYELVKHLDYSVGTNTYVSGWSEWTLVPQNGFTYSASAINLAIDVNGHPWSVACGPQTMQVLRGDANSSTTTVGSVLFPNPLDPDGVPSGVCFFANAPAPVQPTPGVYEGTAQVVACEPGVDCTMYDFDSGVQTLVESATNPWSGFALEYGRYRDGWHILIETGQNGALVSGPQGTTTVLDQWIVHSVDAHWRNLNAGGTGGADYHLYVAAVAEPVIDDSLGPRVVLAWGPDQGPLTEKILPLDHPTVGGQVPTGVGIHADDDRVVIAVAAEREANDQNCVASPVSPFPTVCLDDTVGWALFGLP